jgi:hypothetical protein
VVWDIEKLMQLEADQYIEDMKSLIEAVKSKGIQDITLFASSPYDETVNVDVAPIPGKLQRMLIAAKKLKQIANIGGYQFVDFTSPMAKINRELQKDDSKATIIGSDRTHPGDVGTYIMMYLYAKAQGFTPVITGVEIDAKRAQMSEEQNCEVADLNISQGGEYVAQYTDKELSKCVNIALKNTPQQNP